MTNRLIVQKSRECGTDMWVAVFQMGFDSIRLSNASVSWPTRHRMDGRWQWRIRDCLWHEARWSFEWPFLFNSVLQSAVEKDIGAKRVLASNWETKQGFAYPIWDLLMAFFWCRTLWANSKKEDDWLQKKHRSARTWNSPRQNQDSYQPKKDRKNSR